MRRRMSLAAMPSLPLTKTHSASRSRVMSLSARTQGPARGSGLEPPSLITRIQARLDSIATSAFLMPAVLVVLFLSVFPLIVSLYISMARLKFAKGGFQLTFVGLSNYAKLVVGIDREHFLGVFANPSLIGWLAFGVVAAWLAVSIVRYLRSAEFSLGGLIGRLISAGIAAAGAWLIAHTLSPEGRPGTTVVTLIYVFVGIVFQYVMGLGLALLCVQHIPGRRFFRVVFLLPMMITPVGVAYLFRMLTDTSVGPFAPIWEAFGLQG